MDMWMKIGSAVLVVTMIAVLLPQAKVMMSNSRKASSAEWVSVILPIAAVIGFVVLLISLV